MERKKQVCKFSKQRTVDEDDVDWCQILYDILTTPSDKMTILDIAEMLVEDIQGEPEDWNMDSIKIYAATLGKAFAEVNKEKSPEKRIQKIIETEFDLPYSIVFSKEEVDRMIARERAETPTVKTVRLTMAEIYERLEKELDKDLNEIDMDLVALYNDALEKGFAEMEKENAN